MQDDPLRVRANKLFEQMRGMAEEAGATRRQLDELIPREVSTPDVEVLLERLGAIGEVLDANLSQAADAQQSLQDFVTAAWFFISDRQSTVFLCQLPHHDDPPEVVYKGVICKKDGRHVFCRRHNLRLCVLCGGELR